MSKNQAETKINNFTSIASKLLRKTKNKYNVKSSGPAPLAAVDESINHHKVTLQELETLFNTSVSSGLDQTVAGQLLLKNGKNRIRQKTKNPVLKVVGYLFTGFCSLLWVAAIVCILAWQPIGNPPDPTNLGLGLLLILVILLQAAFSAFQDWSSSKVMKSIKNMMPSSATVIRNNAEKKIAVEEVVVGDLVFLNYGNKVPADVRIIESRDLKFDKSMLTGESEAIEGSVECTDERYVESKNIAYMTTLITNGQGKGIVVATGDQTMMGRIAGLTSQTKEKQTSLQRELKRFVKFIVFFAVTMATIVVIVWIAWLRVQYPSYINVASLMVNTISVMIAFIPEGLPVCVTLALLIIAKRMAKSRVLVKDLSTIETLSCVNVIASDKTGTLTQNKMFVSNAAAGLEPINLNDAAGPAAATSTLARRQLMAVAGLCNNASFDETDAATATRQRRANGDATDVALLKFSAEYTSLAELHDNYTVLAEIPFNSKNKWMMKMVRARNPAYHATVFGDLEHEHEHETRAQDERSSDVAAGDGNELILLKGAPDYLLKKSTHIVQANGDEVLLGQQTISDIIKLQNEWCIQGQRVLLLCKKRCAYNKLADATAVAETTTSSLEGYINRSNDFCIVGLVGIIDPPREGISDVITTCRTAGIRVFMVTGDYALTAAAIAVQIGIFTVSQYDTAETMRIKHKENNDSYERSALLLTGSDLEAFSDDDWRLVTPYDEIVFARTTPEQKLRTVKEFQHDGHIVGVTGDGVNDAPALKSADIGIAMGGGSEVAMEAAQLVLLDNNFASILIAIENGRLVFANLRKVILYLLPGGCMGELIPVLMSIFIGVPQNLASFQMIIISLFTDIAPSLSLMMEKPETNLLAEKPRKKTDHLVDWKFMLQAYVFLGTLVVFCSQTVFFIYMQSNAGLPASQILLSFGIFPNQTTNDAPTLAFNSTLGFNATNSTSTVAPYTGLSWSEYYYRGQTVCFVALVEMQIFGNLMSTRTHIRSFFQQAPWVKSQRNLWVFAAQLTSIGIMLIVVYVPFFNSIFNTRPIPAEFVFITLGFALCVFLLDETRKLLVRRKRFNFHKFGW